MRHEYTVKVDSDKDRELTRKEVEHCLKTGSLFLKNIDVD